MDTLNLHDPENLKTFIAIQAKIDKERILIQYDKIFHIHVVGLTERENQVLRGVLLQSGLELDAFELVEALAPNLVKHYTLDKLTELLKGLGEAPDGHLDKQYSAQCRQFTSQTHDLPETLRFIRNLRDKCVYTAGGSNFVMMLWNFMLSEYPEPEEEKDERHKELKRWAGIS